jgi:hypothetical protein
MKNNYNDYTPAIGTLKNFLCDFVGADAIQNLYCTSNSYLDRELLNSMYSFLWMKERYA